MKKQILTVIILTAVIGTAMHSQAAIETFNFTFTQTGETDGYGNANPPSVTDAIGTLVVDTTLNLALSGSITVGSGPQLGTYSLVLGGDGNNGVFAYDNVVYTGGGPFFNGTIGGLLFTTDGNESSRGVNLWYNPQDQWGQPAGSYSLWGAPPAYNPEAYGTLTLTAVPESASTTKYAGFSALGVLLLTLRRKFLVA